MYLALSGSEVFFHVGIFWLTDFTTEVSNFGSKLFPDESYTSLSPQTEHQLTFCALDGT